MKLSHLLPAFCVALLACSSTVAEEDGSGGSSSTQATGSATTGTGGGAGCAVPESPGTFELGTGERCFERLTEGQTIPQMAGPQGGYHAWLAVACSDCPAKVRLRYGIRDPLTGQVMEFTYPTEVIADLSTDAWPRVAGLQVGLPGLEWDPENPQKEPGTPIILWVEALSQNQLLHAAEYQLVLGESEYWDPCETYPEACGFDSN